MVTQFSPHDAQDSSQIMKPEDIETPLLLGVGAPCLTDNACLVDSRLDVCSQFLLSQTLSVSLANMKDACSVHLLIISGPKGREVIRDDTPAECRQ